MKFILSFLFIFCTFTFAEDKQVSESGIKHSFLFTGNKTCIFDEDSKIIWEVKGASRDGYQLPNGNLLIAFAKEVKEFTMDKKVLFHYKVQKPNGETLHVSNHNFSFEMGHGLFIYNGNSKKVAHAGNIKGFSSSYMRMLEDDLAIIVSINTDNKFEIHNLADEIYDLYKRQLKD